MYDIGDVVPLGITVTNTAGTPEDGGTVVLAIGLPDGTSVTPTVDHVVSSGQYTVDYMTTLEGRHTVRWVVTGANATAYSDVFHVRVAAFQLLSLADTKQTLGITTSDHDEQLRRVIASAGVVVEDHLSKTLMRRTVVEIHPRVCGSMILTRTPVQSLTGVESVDGTATWDVDALEFDPDTGIVSALTGTPLAGHLRSTHVAGMTVIPENYLQAAEIIVEQLWQTTRGVLTIAAYPSTLDDSLDARAGGLIGFAIPKRALELLGKPPPLVA